MNFMLLTLQKQVQQKHIKLSKPRPNNHCRPKAEQPAWNDTEKDIDLFLLTN